MEPELTLIDYLNMPLIELVERFDFSEKALNTAMRLSKMTTTDLEHFNVNLEDIRNG